MIHPCDCSFLGDSYAMMPFYKKEGQWSIQGDPTEGALVVAAEKAGLHQVR